MCIYGYVVDQTEDIHTLRICIVLKGIKILSRRKKEPTHN